MQNRDDLDVIVIQKVVNPYRLKSNNAPRSQILKFLTPRGKARTNEGIAAQRQGSMTDSILEANGNLWKMLVDEIAAKLPNDIVPGNAAYKTFTDAGRFYAP